MNGAREQGMKVAREAWRTEAVEEIGKGEGGRKEGMNGARMMRRREEGRRGNKKKRGCVPLVSLCSTCQREKV